MPKKTVKKVAPKPVSKAEKIKPLNWSTQAFLHSLGVIAYIVFIAYLMFNGETLFGTQDTIVAPIAMLLLLTLSAAVMGLLVFGRPVMLYLDGKKTEALNFAGATVGFLFIEALVIFIILALASW